MIIGTINILNEYDKEKLVNFSIFESYEIYFTYKPRDFYISNYISSYLSLDMKKGAIYLGGEEFYFVPNSVQDSGFERKLGSYFPEYRVYLINPNSILEDKIMTFNKNNKINKMRKNMGKK